MLFNVINSLENVLLLENITIIFFDLNNKETCFKKNVIVNEIYAFCINFNVKYNKNIVLYHNIILIVIFEFW